MAGDIPNAKKWEGRVFGQGYGQRSGGKGN